MTHINKLVLKNFKSFRRAMVPIGDGLTVVAGPNGSGKSNLLDGLVFVMGISSLKTLRAAKLTDLVFNDSKETYAEVTLELKDDEGKEYAIKRVVDKQGRTVYRVNNKRTTMSAATSLLEELGIKASGYNVILQGDVTRVIRMTPQQRREIIDEVAGLKEFEDKKNEALKELNKVEDRIKEARIILGERKAYLDELQKERDDALKYLELTKRKKSVKATILNMELERLQTSTDEAMKRMEEIATESEKVDAEHQAKAKKINEMSKEVEEINKQLLEANEKTYNSIGYKLEEKRTAIKVLEERITQRDLDKGKFDSKLNELNESLKTIRDSMVEIEKKIKVEEKTVELLTKDLEKVQKEKDAILQKLSRNTDAMKLEEDMKNINDSIISEKEKIYDISSQIESLRKEMELQQSYDKKVTDSKEKMMESQQILKSKSSTIALDIKNTKAELDSINREVTKLFSDEKKYNEQYERTLENLRDAREEFVALKSKVATMNEISGKNNAVKAILENKDKIKGVYGTVADLCDYQTKHALAIETAAGPRMFFVVVDTIDTALKCIKYLKSNKLGRATFIPMDKIRGNRIPDDIYELNKKKGSVGFAIDLIDYSAEYKTVFEYIFGSTLVIDDISFAKDIGVGRTKLVSLEGDTAEGSGAMTGGSQSKNKITLKEMENLDKFSEQVKDFEKQKSSILLELEKIREQGNQLRTRKKQFEIKLKEFEVSQESINDRLKEMGGLVIQGAKTNYKSMTQKIEELRIEKAEISKKLKEFEDSKLDFEKKLEKTRSLEENAELTNIDKHINQLIDQRNEYLVKVGNMKTEYDLSLKKRAKEIENEIKRLNSDMNITYNERVAYDKQLVTNKEELAKLEEKLKEISAENAGMLEKKRKMNEEVEAEAEALGKLKYEYNKLEKQKNELNIKMSEYRIKLTDLKEEYSAYQEVEILQEVEVANLKREMPRLDQRIRNLEPVNMRAIESYDVYKKEVDEITDKADKLDTEREAVLSMILKIDTKRDETFMGCYEFVSNKFKDMFASLKGEEAQLRLTNPDDIPNSGLLIEAKMQSALAKDAKMKNIDSMSGGEKTLTAMAFLFAIQAYKPAPFYILDEIDAALDKENSVKLAKLVKSLSTKSQILIITHQDPLMRVSDAIIGVAMTKAKSSVIGLDMNKKLGFKKKKVDTENPLGEDKAEPKSFEDNVKQALEMAKEE